jgi:hypothetical protein
MNDPVVPTKALAAALGLPIWDLRRWQRGGFIPRPRHGHTPVLAALRGALDAIRAEVADPAPYRHSPTQPADTILRADLDAALDRLIHEAERRAEGLTLPETRQGRQIPQSARRAREATIAQMIRRLRAYRRGAVLLAEAEVAHDR